MIIILSLIIASLGGIGLYHFVKLFDEQTDKMCPQKRKKDLTR